MAAGRPLFALISLILTAGAILLIFLTFLAGVSNHAPLNKIYFLQASTATIPSAPPISRWTFWNVCPLSSANGHSGHNACGDVHPAFPLDPPSGRNFGTTRGVPKQFVGTRQYFYLTRFMFAFVLIGLFFAATSLFTGLLALCTRIGSYISGFVGLIALMFQAVTASLMTAAYVKGRNNFKSNHQTASLGRYAFGFMWAAVACLFLSSVLFCLSGSQGRRQTTTYSSGGSGGRGSFLGLGMGMKRRRSTRSKKSNRSRGSFIDGDRKEYL